MIVVRLARRAMATLFELTLVGESESELRSAGEAALDSIERLEEQLSLFLPTSEISYINRHAATRRVPIEGRLYRLLERSAELTRRTDGAFDISVGTLMRARKQRDDEAPTVERALRSAGPGRLDLRDGGVRLTDARTALDLGAIGKGYAIDRAVGILRRHGVRRALLHGGWSTIYALGAPPDADGWTLGLVDPADEEHRIGSVTLRDRALSMSARDGRIEVDSGRPDSGEPLSHVVDPRSGSGATRRLAWASAADATDADALSTAFLLLAPSRIERLCASHDTGAVLLEPEPRAIGMETLFFRERRGFRESPGAGETDLSRRRFLRATAAAAAAFSVGLPSRSTAQPVGRDDVRLGVIGVGEQGRLLLGQLVRMPGARVQAVCDVDDEALGRALEIGGRNIESYSDHRHLLENETLDAVVVATPTYRHTQIALDALGDGLSVYCEAPMAGSIEDCQTLVEAATASRAIFQVGHQRRWSRLYPHALSHLQSGSIGQLFQIRAQWNRRTSWMRRPGSAARDPLINWRIFRETSGGLLLEEGSHIFDIANWLFDATPETVSGLTARLAWRDRRTVDDTVQVMLRYPQARQMHYEATLASSFGDDQEQIVGTAGTMLLLRQSKGLLFKEPDSVTAGWETFARQEMLDNRRGIVLDPSATKYVAEDPGAAGLAADRAAYRAALSAFLRSVVDGEEPLCGAAEGRAAAVCALVALDACEQGIVGDFTEGALGA